MMDSLTELLTALRNNHLRIKREKRATINETIVRRRSTIYGSTVVTIYGPTRWAVQKEVQRAMHQVEIEGGTAHFASPRPIEITGGFGSVGEIFP